MNPEPDYEAAAEAQVLRTMVLLASLATATEVWHAASERRAGRDPSDQEATRMARGYLLKAAASLETMLLSTRAGLAYARYQSEAGLPALVRRFEHLMTFAGMARTLQVVHQRLLSLYPAITETLVEEARLLHNACMALLDGDDDAFSEAAGVFVARMLDFTTGLQDELGAV